VTGPEEPTTRGTNEGEPVPTQPAPAVPSQAQTPPAAGEPSAAADTSAEPETAVAAGEQTAPASGQPSAGSAEDGSSSPVDGGEAVGGVSQSPAPPAVAAGPADVEPVEAGGSAPAGSVVAEPAADRPSEAEPAADRPSEAERAADGTATSGDQVPLAGATGAGGQAGAGQSEEPGRRRLLGRLALGAALLLLLGAAVVLSLQVRGASLDDKAREGALTAAKQTALNLTSIDQEEFDEDVERVLEGATGEFRQDFTARLTELEQLLEENEVTAEGRVLEAGLVRSDRRTATALVVVDSTVSNKAIPQGRVSSYRMKLELEKVGDRWMTSTLDFVG
jgi:Mce-associated membrane protein